MQERKEWPTENDHVCNKTPVHWDHSQLSPVSLNRLNFHIVLTVKMEGQMHLLGQALKMIV